MTPHSPFDFYQGFGTLVLTLTFIPPVFSQTAQETEPDFDIRAAQNSEVAAATPEVATPQAAYAERTFGSDATPLTADWNNFGWPRMLRRSGGSLPKSASRNPVAAARNFLAAHPALFPPNAGSLGQKGVDGQRGLTQVRLHQTIGGSPVYGGQVTVTVNRDGDIVQVHAGEILPFEPGWLPVGGTVTMDNKADIFRDINGDQEPDLGEIPNLSGDRAVSPAQSFDFEGGEGSTGQDPLDFPAPAISNVFYHVNRSHDYFYELGFTETAGNFQMDNFGEGGLGGDPMHATVHTRTNAAIFVRPEGVSPTMRTGRVFNGTRTTIDDRDFAYDSQVIVHEYAHGVTGRLVGGVDSINCLGGIQGGALAEG